jgi:hypothetical protein
MTESAFLRWVADRLVHAHGEPTDVDFVLRLRQLADLAASNGDPELPPFVTTPTEGGAVA